ncbi:allergin-1-like isoform X1 [Bufo gargarizans]|uniref:allergin-1-like isoform X1 n=1 Tax=Bufo gargarizans TaxID=30331 RepID=UPI001CF41C13|nr:allergin-1-like isoform X1 [Bufo gargarizans]
MAPLQMLCILVSAVSTEIINWTGVSTEKLSQPELTVNSPNVMTGHTKTIHCISRNVSLPITYTLFINKRFVEKRTVPEERGATSNITVEQRTVPEQRGATFNVTIYNETSLGPYKCKANNSLMQPVYSKELTFTLQEKLSQPELTVKSPNVMTGHTKTIHCISRNGSLPITYTLFINKTFVEERTVPEERGATSNVTVEQRTVPEERGATFNVTIYNETSLGPYKCSTNNSLMQPVYSEELTFTLQVEKNRRGYLEWLIPVLILIGILVITAFIGIARHKKGRARREEDQYCVVGPINGREDGSKRCEDQDIEYCSMVLRGPPRAAIRTEESVEYMEVALKRS